MNQEVNEISINGVAYVRKDAQQKEAELLDGMPYVIVRTYSAGVFAGYLSSKIGQEVIIKRARRLWYWSGAASLSQLSVDGVAKSNDCKFPCEVDSVNLLQAIEILPCTAKAQKTISEVATWKM